MDYERSYYILTACFLFLSCVSRRISGCRFPGGGALTITDYGEAPPERGTLFRLEVYKRVATSRVKVCKRDANYRKLTFRYQKGHSKYLEQTHPTADSSKYLKGFL